MECLSIFPHFWVCHNIANEFPSQFLQFLVLVWHLPCSRWPLLFQWGENLFRMYSRSVTWSTLLIWRRDWDPLFFKVLGLQGCDQLRLFSFSYLYHLYKARHFCRILSVNLIWNHHNHPMSKATAHGVSKNRNLVIRNENMTEYWNEFLFFSFHKSEWPKLIYIGQMLLAKNKAFRH